MMQNGPLFWPCNIRNIRNCQFGIIMHLFREEDIRRVFLVQVGPQKTCFTPSKTMDFQYVYVV